MTPEQIWNERLKLFASYLNGLAIAMITAGVFGPIISYVYGIFPNVSPLAVFLSALGCFVVSGAIHFVAQTILEELQ
jgi:FtsH-binding integral membrane protein